MRTKCWKCWKVITGEKFKCNITTKSFCSKSCRLSFIREKDKIKKEKEKLKQQKQRKKDLDKQKRQTKRESLPKLIKKLDTLFSIYIRNKYSKKWLITCISCDKEIPISESHNCHWIGRWCKKYRWEEDNCRPWCSGCNTFNQEFHQRVFTTKQIERLWIDKVNEMLREEKKIHKVYKQDLLDKIAIYKELTKDFR